MKAALDTVVQKEAEVAIQQIKVNKFTQDIAEHKKAIEAASTRTKTSADQAEHLNSRAGLEKENAERALEGLKKAEQDQLNAQNALEKAINKKKEVDSKFKTLQADAESADVLATNADGAA